MRKKLELVGIMLMSGVLVLGIGCGIAFAEYSTFSYGGQKVLEGSEYFTKTINYTVSADVLQVAEDGEKTDSEETEEAETENTADKEVKPELHLYVYHGYNVEVDTSVPRDGFKVEVTYLTDNKNLVPVVKEAGDVNYLYLDCGFEYDEFRDFMRAKDVILKDIKNHTLSEIQPDMVQVTILMHPEAEFQLTPIYH